MRILLMIAFGAMAIETSSSQDEKRVKKDISLLHGIYPGTKWCGKGNIAKSPDDFGTLKDLDMCCMKHDSCPMTIGPGQEKYGIKNNGMYYMLHCGCDDDFHNCLKVLGTKDSEFLGEIYFDILKMKCFLKEHPKVCIKWHWWGTCREYKEDKSKGPVTQIMSPRPFK